MSVLPLDKAKRSKEIPLEPKLRLQLNLPDPKGDLSRRLQAFMVQHKYTSLSAAMLELVLTGLSAYELKEENEVLKQ
jgi:hypothetical protein